MNSSSTPGNRSTSSRGLNKGNTINSTRNNHENTPMRSVFLLLLTFLAIPGIVTADSLVFISIKGEQRLAAYRLDEESGKLTHLADTKTKGEPGNLTCDAARGLLFVAMRSTGELASF